MQSHTRSGRGRYLALLAALGCLCLLAIYYRAAAGDVASATGDRDRLRVSSRAELMRALDDTRGGFTIELAPGDYGTVRLVASEGEPSFARPVTIRSSDPCAPARFRHMTLRGVSNIVLEGLRFENPDFFNRPREEMLAPNGQLKNLDLLRTDDVTGITVRDSVFAGPTVRMDGSRDNGYGYGFGWKGRNVRNATFTGNELTNLYKGVSLRLGGGMVISGNSLHDYRSDAIYIAEAEDITILDNRMTDPRPFLLPRGQADHPDFIQIAEIDGGLIENNYMDIGVTAEFSQGIFGGPNRNLVIRNNVIATRATNGLSFGSLTNSEIANNLVVDAVLPPHMERVSPGRQRQQPRLHVRPSYSDVRVTGNLASMYNRGFDQASRSGQVAAAGNSLVQSLHPRGPNYYEYHADAGARASSGAGLRIGNVWLATVPASTGFDAARFTYLDEGPARAPGRCRRT